MDRRRFIPKPEGLEGRALLSNIFGSSGTSNTQRTIQNMPDTWVEKTNRVEHLPYYLQQIDPNSPIPQAALSSVQNALTPIIGQLHAANTQAIDNFNLTLRKVNPHQSLSASNAAQLNNTFASVISSAGATPDQTAALKSSMNDLAKGAANSTQPVVVASNEYAIVLQIGLGIGRPIQTPLRPKLQKNNGTELVNGTGGSTPLTNPEFVGTYLAGNNSAVGTTIQIVDSNGVVHASGATNKLGNYLAPTEIPFTPGKYTLHARAVDSQGHMSILSTPYQLNVYTRRVPH